MQCRYCGVKNPATVRVCVSCSKPLPAHGPVKKWPGKPHTSHVLAVRPSIEPSALGSVSTHSGEIPRISHLMHSTSIPSAQASPAGLSQAPDGINRPRTGAAAGGARQQAKPQATQGADSQYQRVEPQLDSSARQPSRKPNYEELRAIAALYDTPQVPKRRSWMRAGIIAMIFIVGGAVGFGAASLLPEKKSTGVLEQRRFVVHGGISPGKGTSPGELPYDGKGTAESSSGERPATAGISTGELPYGDRNASDESAAQSGPGGTPSETLTSEVSVPPPVKQELVPARSPAEKRPEQVATPVVKKASPASPRQHRSLRRANKDREIERIRQQATEELKKKIESRRRTDESRNKTHAASKHALAMSTKLAQCEQAGNFLLRERCKWQLCDGKWGKDGCPSYLPQVSSR